MFYAILVSFAIAASGGVPAAGQPAAGPSAGSADPGRHEVVKANTLWDLSARYCKDPWQWPRIHEANRDKIRDPHWIYPGQVFLIPCVGKQVVVYPKNSTVTETVSTIPAPEPEKPAAIVKPPIEETAPAPPPDKESEGLSIDLPAGMTGLHTSATRFQAPKNWKASGAIVDLGAQESLASTGDSIDVQIDAANAVKGQRYEALRPAAAFDEGEDPRGRYFERVGELEVARRVSGKKYQARIVRANGPVQIGDLLRPAR